MVDSLTRNGDRTVSPCCGAELEEHQTLWTAAVYVRCSKCKTEVVTGE